MEGIAEDGRAGQTYRRSIGDRYLTMVYNGDHCVGCHGRGHVITDCQFFSLLHPIDYYPNEESPPK